MEFGQHKQLQQSYKQKEQTLEIFQLTKRSTQEDFNKLIDWVKKCFDEQQFNLINVMVKRLPTFDSNAQNNSNIKNTFQPSAAAAPSQPINTEQTENPVKDQSSLSENDRAKQLFIEASKLYKEQQYTEAEQKYTEVLQNCSEDNQNHSAIIINSQVYKGSSLLHLKKVEESIDILEKTLDLVNTSQVQENSKASLCFIHTTLGQAYSEKKSPQKMVDHFLEATKCIENNQEPETEKQLGHLYNNIGLAYIALNKNDEAIEYFEKSYELYKKVLGEDNIAVGTRLSNLAEAHKNNKNYQKALEYYNESLRIKRAKYGTDNEKSISNTISSIGMTYYNMKGDYIQQGIQYFEQAVEISKNIYGDKNQSQEGKQILGNLYLAMGDSYKSLKNPKEASHYYSLSYELRKEIFGTQHKQSMHVAVTYAQTLYGSKQYTQAIAVFQELLENQRAVFGEKSTKVAQTLNNLGTVLSEVKEYEESLQCISEALEIFKADPNIDQQYIIKGEKNQEAIKKRIKKQQEERENQQ